MNKELGKKVYESKLVVNCESYEELIEYLDFLNKRGCESILGPINEIKETVILDLWNKLFKSICVRIDKGIIKYIHFNNIRFYKNLMGEDCVITYKELMNESNIPQPIKASNALKSISNKMSLDTETFINALNATKNNLSTDDTKDFKKFENAMSETHKMIQSEQYKKFIEKCKNDSEKVPYINGVTIKPNIKFVDSEFKFGTSGNLNVQNCKCYIENKLFKDSEEKKEYIDNKKVRIDNYEKHKNICNSLNSIYVSKNHDYGNSFSETFDKLGIISAVTRISDKVNRLQNLCNNERKVNDESMIDTLMDLANYSIMTIMELEKDK